MPTSVYVLYRYVGAERRNSSALATELRLFGPYSSIWFEQKTEQAHGLFTTFIMDAM